MASFTSLTASLNLNISNFVKRLNTASAAMNKFAKNSSGNINAGVTKEAEKSAFAFKDVSRIVSGILISQAFYSGLGAIREATYAVWDFTSSLEYAEIAYSNLFGDVALAEEFINVLKDFAAVTPFDFSDAEAAAKRLLAYGIEYKNVMYVMQGVLAASTASGNPATIESISRALGQIHTKGRLYNEEMRQLTEAGIPAYEILQEKLGLTQDQLKNLADNAISSTDAINALVDGINERFGGVLEASSMTMQGLISNLRDNLLMISSEAIQPLFNNIKALLIPFVEFITMLRSVTETQGIGGLFETLIPEDMHQSIRQLIANLMNLGTVLGVFVKAGGEALQIVLHSLLLVFNAFAPILTAVADILGRVALFLLSNATVARVLTVALAAAAAMWVIFKIQAVASVVVTAVINGIAAAFAGLVKVMTFVVAHPIWALLLTIGGIIVGLTGGFGSLTNAVNGFFKSLTSFNGVDPDKLLLPSQEERASDLDKFNEALSGTSDSMDDLADSTGNAAKAAKGLLSFDEVFKLNEPDEGTGSGIDDLGDFDFGDLGGIGGSLIPDIPSFDGFANDFVDNLLAAFGGLDPRLISAGIGSLIGAAIGGIFGGPAGAVIGAALGALAGWFWPELADKLGLSDFQMIATPIGLGIGAAIGGLKGGPVGALLGGAIGSLVSWVVSEIYEGITTGDWTGVAKPIGLGLGAAIGGLIGGPFGAIIGGAIGLLVGNIIDLFIKGFSTGEWDVSALSNSLGTAIGAGIGFIIGGPVGALIGAAVGKLVGWIVGLIVDNWDAIVGWFQSIGETIANFFSTLWNNISGWVSDTWWSFSNWAADVTGVINDWREDVNNAVVTFVTDTASNIYNWAADTWNSFATWVSDTSLAIGQWAVDRVTDFATWATETGESISTWASNTWNNFSTWVSDTNQSFTTWRDDNIKRIGDWSISTFNSISSWVSTTSSQFSSWSNSVKSKVASWASSAWGTISSWASNTWTSISTWTNDTISAFAGWFTTLDESFGGFFSGLWTDFSNFFTNLWDDLLGWLSNIGNSINNWWSGLWSNKEANVEVKHTSSQGTSGSSYTQSMSGHARGGVFNREHIARFNEGNKAEAIIPLETASAMEPFTNAVSSAVLQSLMPIIASSNSSSTQNEEDLRPIYVGTLIADDNGLKELERKMRVIRVKEERRGVNG